MKKNPPQFLRSWVVKVFMCHLCCQNKWIKYSSQNKCTHLAQLKLQKNLYSKLKQMISCFYSSSSCYSSLRPAVWMSPEHTSPCLYKLLISPPLLAFGTSVNIWKGDWLRLWSGCLEPVRPFWLEQGCAILYGMCAPVKHGPFCSFCSFESEAYLLASLPLK